MNRIAELLKQNGMTQHELAEAVGVAPTSMSRWIRGIRTPTVTDALKICDVLGETVEAVFSEKPGQSDLEV